MLHSRLIVSGFSPTCESESRATRCGSASAATTGRTTAWAVTGRNLLKVDRWLISGRGVEVVAAEAASDTSATVTVRVEGGAEPGVRELRAVGTHGLSNLALVRVDRLPQTVEAEPNDEPGRANEVVSGSAVAGVLTALDRDHFRVRGQSGGRLTIEVEAQRLGSPVVDAARVPTEA